jgi:hypothetical protein
LLLKSAMSPVVATSSRSVGFLADSVGSTPKSRRGGSSPFSSAGDPKATLRVSVWRFAGADGPMARQTIRNVEPDNPLFVKPVPIRNVSTRIIGRGDVELDDEAIKGFALPGHGKHLINVGTGVSTVA